MESGFASVGRWTYLKTLTLKRCATLKPFALCMALLVCSIRLASGQAAAPPPPPVPAPDAPSLAATMKFIQDKLNDMGKLTYVYVTNDGQRNWFANWEQVTTVVASPTACTLSWHVRSGQSTNPDATDQDLVVQLGSVSKIKSEPQAIDGTAFDHTVPAITELDLYTNQANQAWISFDDADLADRVAKALAHAMELCQASKPKDPF